MRFPRFSVESARVRGAAASVFRGFPAIPAGAVSSSRAFPPRRGGAAKNRGGIAKPGESAIER